jgi:hypothetical protein
MLTGNVFLVIAKIVTRTILNFEPGKFTKPGRMRSSTLTKSVIQNECITWPIEI